MTIKELQYRQPILQSRAWLSVLVTTITSIALNIILHAHVRTSLVSQYPNDSFYTLSTVAAIGLGLITITLLVLVLLTAWWSTMIWIKRASQQLVGQQIIRFVFNVVAIAAVYFLLLVIAPQVFYTYYQWVFTGLPAQWVIKPLAPEVLLNLVKLPSNASMADHLAGFTFWVLIFNTVMQWAWYLVYSKSAKSF